MQTMALSFTELKQNTCWSRTGVRHVQKKKHWNIKTYVRSTKLLEKGEILQQCEDKNKVFFC